MQVSDDEIETIVLMRKMFKRSATPVPYFLHWIARRLVEVYNESELMDFVQKTESLSVELKAISNLLGVRRDAE